MSSYFFVAVVGVLLIYPPRAESQTQSQLESLRLRTRQARDLVFHGDYEKAEAAFLDLVAEAKRQFGSKSAATLDQRQEFAVALLTERKFPAAENEFRDIEKLRNKSLGADHLDTLQTRYDLAISLCSQHKHSEAEAEYRAVLAGQEHVLGINNPKTLRTCYRLAQCLQMQGRVLEAQPFAQRAYEGSRQDFGETDFHTRNYKILWLQLTG